ncbi:T9SS type A sorting domain-containing protein [uncultured Lacinutrix sp.]|uniref:T9SS type A sorting domain-containing protein n=1 Tax=uncultured Lacinutrix sp. TaxID=574032 RepID=UPI002627B886|nr:T9SS type A sorting domain-containing protein [uncultured Lacinutrix sp.]
MEKKLPIYFPQVKRLQNFLMLFVLCFSIQSYATTIETFESSEDTYCGSISGFEFSNGNSSTPIQYGGEYILSELPSNFYVNLKVNGYLRSANFRLVNLDTGQYYNINESSLPYTFPGGNGAWSYGTGRFKVVAKVYKYNNCNGWYCDKEVTKFTITNNPSCGTISGFEFTNGNSSVTIEDNGEYSLDQLPNNFYTDIIVDGFSESASIKVKNKNTGQQYTIGENYLPYTFPGGNGAWNLPAAEYEIEAKIFKYANCAGSYCDREKISFTLTNSSSCGEIDGLVFSNGTNTIAIANGGSYDVASLPYNFYVDVVVSGMTESASHKITNLDTGEVFNNGTNSFPYTYPSGNQAWNLGTGTFQFYSEIFKYDNCVGTRCDHICYTFTIYEQNCGDIAELQFSNGTDTITIEDGEAYNINNLPSNFYIDAIVSGASESVRLEVENLETNEEYSIIENYIPYTFPAGNGAWNLGLGTFEVKASMYSGNYCNSTLCDEKTLTFTITDENTLCEVNTGTITLDNSIISILNLSSPVTVNIVSNGDAVVPQGYNTAILLSRTNSSNNTVIEEYKLSSNFFFFANGYNSIGDYKIHSLVYNPTSLDLSSISVGNTTITDVANTISGNDVCASFDEVGVPFSIMAPPPRIAEETSTEGTPIKGETLVSEEVDETVEIDPVVEVEVLPSTKNNVDIKLYPNPVVDNLNVELLLLDAEVMKYNMVDLNGRQVLQGSFDNSTFGKTSVDVNGLSNGLYIITFRSNFRTFSKKIQVNH